MSANINEQSNAVQKWVNKALQPCEALMLLYRKFLLTIAKKVVESLDVLYFHTVFLFYLFSPLLFTDM